jgi:hypothetical protein
MRPERQGRPRLSADLLTELAGRLTRRDRWLLHMLFEHRVLTTTQITQLAFGALSTGAHRMQHLWWLRAVDRVQPFTATGSAPMHYVLGDGGAAVLAAEHGITAAELGYRRDRALATFHSVKLAHTVGINGIFTALVAHARANRGSVLDEWWPEHRCAAIWGDLIRPDGYGRWRDHGAETDFFLEYDTGSETTGRVAAKLPGYADLTDATGITTPVLFWFPAPGREAGVRAAFGDTPVPVATAAARHGDLDPAGPVWLPLGQRGPTQGRPARLPAGRPPPCRPCHLKPTTSSWGNAGCTANLAPAEASAPSRLGRRLPSLTPAVRPRRAPHLKSKTSGR